MTSTQHEQLMAQLRAIEDVLNSLHVAICRLTPAPGEPYRPAKKAKGGRG